MAARRSTHFINLLRHAWKLMHYVLTYMKKDCFSQESQGHAYIKLQFNNSSAALRGIYVHFWGFYQNSSPPDNAHQDIHSGWWWYMTRVQWGPQLFYKSVPDERNGVGWMLYVKGTDFGRFHLPFPQHTTISSSKQASQKENFIWP